MEFQLRKCLNLRAQLKQSLKDQFPVYVAAIVEWIRRRKSRTELDVEVFGILEDSLRKTHLDFMVTLSKLCWGLSSLRIEASITPATAKPDWESQRLGAPLEQNSQDEGYIFQKRYTDLTLPGLELIKARLYLAAWNAGLTNVDSKVSRLLLHALRHYLKDVIQTAFADDTSSATNKTKTVQALSLWWAITRTNCDRPSIQYCPVFTKGIQDSVKAL